MSKVIAPEELIVDLRHALQQRHARPHPIRQLLLSGRLTREQLQSWAKNQFHEFRNIHRFFGIRYQKCPVPELRRMLLENMVEEEGEDLFGGKYPSHRDLWVQFAGGLGIERDEILTYEPLPEFGRRWKCIFPWCNKVTGPSPSVPVWSSRAGDLNA